MDNLFHFEVSLDIENNLKFKLLTEQPLQQIPHTGLFRRSTDTRVCYLYYSGGLLPDYPCLANFPITIGQPNRHGNSPIKQ